MGSERHPGHARREALRWDGATRQRRVQLSDGLALRAAKSIAARSSARWAIDVTHIDCDADGWGHLMAVMDGHDREVLGWEFALRARAREAKRALEQACLARFGTLRPLGATPIVRSDNGLIFQSTRFRAACRDDRLAQEFVTPYTPEQNGLIERWFRSVKEECVWLQTFCFVRRGVPRRPRVDRRVRPRAPAPGARRQEPARVQGSRDETGGLTRRERNEASAAARSLGVRLRARSG